MKRITNHLNKAIVIATSLNSRLYVVYPVCLVIGLLFAIKYVLPYNFLAPEQIANIDSVYMWVRSEFLNRALNAVSGVAFVPIVDHESAYYYYLAYIGQVIGKSQPWELFLFVQSVAAFILFTVYPLLINRLTRSWICTCISPLLLNYFFSEWLFVWKSDSIWAYTWVIVLAAPLVGILLKSSGRLSKKEYVIVLLLSFVISFANVVRTNASLPVFAVVLVVLGIRFIQDIRNVKDKPTENIFRRLLSSRAMIVAILALFVSYGLMNAILPQFVFKSVGYKQYNFGPWHTAYIGFGFEENPYGIKYADEVAMQKVNSIDPSVFYSTTESMDKYMAIIKAEYFNLYKENPEYFVASYIRKLKACINNSINSIFDSNKSKYLALALGLSCFALFFMRTQKRNRLQHFLYLLICLIVMGFIGMLPGMIAIPDGMKNLYLRGAIAAGLMVLMMMIFFVVNALSLYVIDRSGTTGDDSVRSSL